MFLLLKIKSSLRSFTKSIAPINLVKISLTETTQKR